MLELLLFGQVPDARHEQILKILSGVAAMQPRRHIQYHAVFQPIREPSAPGRNVHVGGTQGVAQKQTNQTQANKDLYYTHLVKDLEETEFGGTQATLAKADPAGTGTAGTSQSPQSNSREKWALQFNDVPDPVKRPVTLRMTSQTDIVSGDATAYMSALGYRYVSDYILEGHRYVHKNVILFLYRVMRFPLGGEPQKSPRQSFPPFSELVPLDDSGAYVLQATVRVADNERPNIISDAVQELEAFGKLMRGSVYMDVANRLALDTRVKYKPRAGG